MAQGLDSKTWKSDKSPKVNVTVKRLRVMGSRRIFPPHFKLKVLDSYRNDLDCRGNQRATARKYNIHRRQIQKWLQCEQNLRTSVEESAKSFDVQVSDNIFQRIEKKCETNSVGQNSDGKMDSALNRSAMIYTRLNDAVRTREENAVRPTLKQETKVLRPDEPSQATQLEAQNLKRVAQKLYPSCHPIPHEPVDINKREGAMLKGGHVGAPDFYQNIALSPKGISDSVCVPLDLKNKPRSGPEDVPKECLLNDTPKEIFTVQTEDAMRSRPVRPTSDKLSMSEDDSVLLRENVEGQKLCQSNAVPKCLVQKYTNGEGLELCSSNASETRLLCSPSVDVESSSLLDLQVPVTCIPYLGAVSKDEKLNSPYSSSSDQESVGSPMANKRKASDDFDISPTEKSNSDDLKSRMFKNLNDPKSFSPKRKWMKESLQEMESESPRSRSSPVLPIKQRVKMNLRSGSSEETTPSPKGVSPNFTIERLCSSDIKSENVTPVSFHSPVESSCYNWRPDPCGYAPMPLFPPPYILPHRAIPNLVSLHFKPEVFEQKDSQSVGSYSPTYQESIDIPLKQEKVSDSEETDVDIMSTTPVEKKTFDFSNCSAGKRRSFPVPFKITVLDAYHNDKDCNKNQRATVRKFGINRRQVQKWLSQENELRSEGSIKNGKYLQRQRLRNDRDLDNMETCTQCPQHCLNKRRDMEEMDNTIEVNVKHCSDKECLSRDQSNPENVQNPFNESLDYLEKSCFQSDLKSVNIYDNYLIRENNNMVYHDSFLNWPNFNASALPVPNFQYMSWYHNYDYCHEKSKIY